MIEVATTIPIPMLGWKRTKKGKIPTSWEEAEGSSLFLLRLLLRYPLQEARLRALRHFLKLKRYHFLAMRNADLTTLVRFLNWMDIGPVDFPVTGKFEQNGITYHLPAKQFRDGTALEYPMADDYYRAWVTTGKLENLRLLTATLARPKVGEEREPINARSQVEARAEAFSDLELNVMVAVLMYWTGVKQYIHQTYAGWLFPSHQEDETDEEDESLAPKDQGAMFGWYGVFMDVAEAGLFGDLKAVHQTNFHTICMYLVKKKKEQMDMEDRMASAKKTVL